ncbi:LysR family transcriptional regulator [Azospirillum sp. RWY-5-1]|uniref:LysR family transcriptional regulator n=1 Tax=Azospirillum oleiclasticum TaxID=2735135 RepID=A0ABX2TLK5_9PROT|nr:LysR substrate-binding domain-containing protein [Azospirillum oleiclasticum]NYZ17659.1 LysR family transcriptional regulator [Azospirillum oleiclasticum]NYZ25014.1 LysR family transcriptional regulator [Azospirillum oleiclasticum]
MEIRQLRYFVQIIESGSLSRASQRLHIAQPALSQQLKQLEEEIGKPLLNRSSKGVTPTESGLALYHHARFLLRQFDQSIAIVRSEAGAIRGMVSVGLPATTVSALGLQLVRRVRQRFPGVLLNVVEGMSGHIGQLMRLGQLDLAVLFSPDLAPDLVTEPLMVEELFFIIPEHSALIPAGRTAVSLAEAAAVPLILPTGVHGLRQRIAAEFENRGLSLNVVAEIDSLSLLMNCVYDEVGATIKPMGAVMQEQPKGRRWRCLSFSDVAFQRRNFLYSLPSERLTPAAAVVAAEIKETVRELIEGKAWPGFEEPAA